MKKETVTLYNDKFDLDVSTRKVDRYFIRAFNRKFYISPSLDFIFEKRLPKGWEWASMFLIFVILVFLPWMLALDSITVSDIIIFFILETYITARLLKPW